MLLIVFFETFTLWLALMKLFRSVNLDHQNFHHFFSQQEQF